MQLLFFGTPAKGAVTQEKVVYMGKQLRSGKEAHTHWNKAHTHGKGARTGGKR